MYFLFDTYAEADLAQQHIYDEYKGRCFDNSVYWDQTDKWDEPVECCNGDGWRIVACIKTSLDKTPIDFKQEWIEGGCDL